MSSKYKDFNGGLFNILTEKQIKFLDDVCIPTWKLDENGEVEVLGDVWFKSNKNLTEIPVKFSKVEGHFDCSECSLTTLKNCPDFVGGNFDVKSNNLTILDFSNYIDVGGLHIGRNNLTEYFKTIKDEDFPYWCKLDWWYVMKDYPFLVNIGKMYINKSYLIEYLKGAPLTKLYFK